MEALFLSKILRSSTYRYVLIISLCIIGLIVSGCFNNDNQAAASPLIKIVRDPINMPGNISSINIDNVAHIGNLYKVELSVHGDRSYHVTGYINSNFKVLNFTEV